MRVLTIVLAVLLGNFAGSMPAFATHDVTIVSDVWMPYTGKPNSHAEGYAIDILRSIFADKQYRVVYKELPWSRAIDAAKKGEADIIVSVFKFELPNFIYPNTNHGISRLAFYTSNKEWKFHSHASLDSIKVGLVEGYGYREWILKLAAASPSMYHKTTGADAFQKLVRMLAAKRIDVVPSNPFAMSHMLAELGLTEQVSFAGYDTTCPDEPFYYALSPENREKSLTLAAKIDEGMRTLRASGKMRKILEKYNLSDWE